MKEALPGIIEKVLKIHLVHSEDLPDKIQITRQKEADLLRKVTDQNGHTFVLHLEIQTRDDPDMAYRMLEYRIMAEQVYRLAVRQYVIYLGEKTSQMPTHVDSPGLKYQYTLISFRKLPYRLFLSSDKPEEKILAVLGNFGTEPPGQVLQSVISQIRDASKNNLTENQYLQQLRIIIQLRNLAKEFNKIMEPVATFFKEEKDPFFIKGKVEGKAEGKGEVVRNLLQTGRFTRSEIVALANVEEAFVRKIEASLREE